jgi:ribosome maturation factor RimP
VHHISGEILLAKLETTLENMIEPAVIAVGFDLWGVEFIRAGKHSILRVYVDGPEGVSIEGCAEASRQISGILDVEDPISDVYTLEVSSPGMDRVLFKQSQYQAYIGEVLALKTRLPIDGRRKFKGVLDGIEGDSVILSVDNDEFSIPFKNIDKAQIVPRF